MEKMVQHFNTFLIKPCKNVEDDESKINILLNLICPQGIKCTITLKNIRTLRYYHNDNNIDHINI